MPRIDKDGKNVFLEFSFIQMERDNILKHCSLGNDIKKRFRKIVSVGSLITVVFYKKEAEEMLESLSKAALGTYDDNDLKLKFGLLHSRFESVYNEVFQ